MEAVDRLMKHVGILLAWRGGGGLHEGVAEREGRERGLGSSEEGEGAVRKKGREEGRKEGGEGTGRKKGRGEGRKGEGMDYDERREGKVL